MAIYLVRHGKAGVRGMEATDRDRPLDEIGRMQAKEIAEILGGAPIGRIISSPALRCRQTVAPLAEQLAIAVEVDEALFEGDHGQALELVQAVATNASDTVLCSHGDVIPAIVDTLYYRGVKVDRLGKCAKGSIWTLAVEDGEVCRATYRKVRGD